MGVKVNNYVNTTTCCGLYELHNVAYANPLLEISKDAYLQQLYKPPEFFVQQIQDAFYRRNKKPLVVFTDNTRNQGGHALAKYIERNKLGIITRTHQRLNPNSKNDIHGWLWSVDFKIVSKKEYKS